MEKRLCKYCGEIKSLASFPTQWYRGYKTKEKKYRVPKGRCYDCYNKQLNEYYHTVLKFKDGFRESEKERHKIWRKENPWRDAYDGALNRCRKGGKYYHRGIKILMTVSDFKQLWFRDKAYLLKVPSIDRIDRYGNYSLENCRWIEFKENQRRPKAKVPRR